MVASDPRQAGRGPCTSLCAPPLPPPLPPMCLPILFSPSLHLTPGSSRQYTTCLPPLPSILPPQPSLTLAIHPHTAVLGALCMLPHMTGRKCGTEEEPGLAEESLMSRGVGRTCMSPSRSTSTLLPGREYSTPSLPTLGTGSCRGVMPQ